MKKKHIYMACVFLLGLVYYPAKQLLGGGAQFVAAMFAAAVVSAWLAHRFGK